MISSFKSKASPNLKMSGKSKMSPMVKSKKIAHMKKENKLLRRTTSIKTAITLPSSVEALQSKTSTETETTWRRAQDIVPPHTKRL